MTDASIPAGALGGYRDAGDLTPKIELPVSGRVMVDGVEHLVERRLGDHWHLLSLEKDVLFLSDKDVAAKMAAGAFLVRHGDARTRDALSPLVVGEKAAIKNLKKYAYVRACLDLPCGPTRSRPALLPTIEAVAAQRGEKVPGFSTVLGWLDLYEAHGGTFGLASLSDRDDVKGKTGSRLPAWAEEAIAAGLEEYKKPQTTIAAAYVKVKTAVAAFSKRERGLIDGCDLYSDYRQEDGSLRPPCLRTFERRVADMDPIERDLARKGPAYVNQKYSTWQTLPLPDRPYETVEVDHCTLDIRVMDDAGVVFGRPDLVVFRDRATAMILGYGLGFEAPTRLAGPGPSADMFVGSEVRAFVELVEHRAVVVDQPGLAFDEFCQRSNRSPGEVAFAVIQGRQNITRRGDRGFAGMQLPIADAVVVKADGPKPRRTCQHSGIGFADAASRLGISPIAVSGLVEAGHLKIQDGTIGRRQRIAPDSLDNFDAKYAAVGAYARAFNLSPQKVSADFRAAGVTILDRNGRQKVPWADRISVVSAMGDEWDLRRQLDPFSSMVWEALRSHLRSTGSPNRLVDTVSTSARIRSGSGHTLLHVSTCPTGKLIIASAQANRAAASAWLELLTKRQDDVCEMWPQALVTRASDSIRFEQIFAVGTAGTTGQLHHVARLIDQIATNLRMLRLTEKAAA